jgi:small-conductance mechanosensitive channel
MLLFATQVGLFTAELEARGFLRGVGRTILIVIVILVVLGALIGFSAARRFGRRG